MKKKYFLICFIIVFIAAIIFVVCYFGRVLYLTLRPNDNTSSNESYCPYEKEITILNDNFPSDIIIYGEDVLFDNRLKYRTVSELTESTLNSGSEFKYSFLVINDRSGNLKISDEEFILCKRLCDQKGQNFVYLGEQYLSHLQDFDFCQGLYQDNLRGIAYIRDPMGHHAVQGFWTATEEEYSEMNQGLLGQVLVYVFVNLTINKLN